jgi:hypothetical protein
MAGELGFGLLRPGRTHDCFRAALIRSAAVVDGCVVNIGGRDVAFSIVMSSSRVCE